MSNQAEREAEDNYEAENDASPVTSNFVDNSYARETNPYLKDKVPVEVDQTQVEDPMVPHDANTDEQLGKTCIFYGRCSGLIDFIDQDEREAPDRKSILKGDRLRHAKPRTANKYNEGPNEDDLPPDIRDGLTGVSGTTRLT